MSGAIESRVGANHVVNQQLSAEQPATQQEAFEAALGSVAMQIASHGMSLIDDAMAETEEDT
ncbi:hypothetical protein Q2941_11025 [Bradyrhizobium sp. UFLA05-153]